MLYRACWFLAQALLRPFFRIRWVGQGNVPRAGGVILAGNHVSYLDPIVIPAGLWRPVSFMAKAELFAIPVLGWLLRALHSFPVRRDTADRGAIAKASRRLEGGWAVGIFPEGTRVREGGGQGQEGAAFLAMRTGAPIVPVGIDGTGGVRPPGVRSVRFPRISVAYGEPIEPGAFAGGSRERVSAMTAELMAGIGAALDEARRV
ncbi:MAG: 1-acyl-sn-glycerol-3-phosphate acyltransferase [Coriobacteriia bacterium]|nr:1-acyl-sn-glycerol-3-phosphate acyltransferase [Coriobacteriia bacterium]